MKIKNIFLSILALASLLFTTGCDIPTAEPPINTPINTSASENTPSNPQNSDLTVHFLDVGQGDSTFIELPNGKTMLIDAGEESEADGITTYIFSQGYDTIDYVIATHPHADHIGGMPEVLNNFIINSFFTTEAESTSEKYLSTINYVLSQNTAAYTVSTGDIIINEPDLNLTAEIAAPTTIDPDNPNNSSIVLKLTYKNIRFLFTGDAEKEEEDSIRSNIKCDVLKIGHHGSSTSTSQNFLKKTEPKYAVISCGLFNSYGHPTEKTLSALADKGIKTYRTDRQGTIIFTSDGENITVNKDPSEYTPKPTSSVKPSSSSAPFVTSYPGIYVLNTNTKRIHYLECESAKKTKDKNKKYTLDYDLAVSNGYKPCSICNPQ